MTDHTQELAHQALSLISHELKSPLVAINGALSTLRLLNGKLPHLATLELLRTAEQEGQYLSALLEALINVANLRSNPESYLPCCQDLRSVVASRLGRLEDAGLMLVVEHEESPVTVLVNTDVFGTLFDWLCGYLGRKTGGGLQILIGVRKQGVSLAVERTCEPEKWTEIRRGLEDGLKYEILKTLLESQRMTITWDDTTCSGEIHFAGCEA